MNAKAKIAIMRNGMFLWNQDFRLIDILSRLYDNGPQMQPCQPPM